MLHTRNRLIALVLAIGVTATACSTSPAVSESQESCIESQMPLELIGELRSSDLWEGYLEDVSDMSDRFEEAIEAEDWETVRTLVDPTGSGTTDPVAETALVCVAADESVDALAAFIATSTTTTTTTTLGPLTGPPRDYAQFRQQDAACGATTPPETTPQQFTTYDDVDVAPATLATLTTSCGVIVIELDPEAAPETVKSFVFLAGQGYFDGTAIHRILPGFVIQAGDPAGNGFGNPGYAVPDEFPPDGFAYEEGVVAMANAGPGSTGSQFFLMVGNSNLPPTFNAFGRIVAGDVALAAIVGVPLGPTTTGELSVPLESVYIESVTIATP